MHTLITRLVACALLLLATGILVAGPALAQQADNPEMAPAATYDISWWTVDGGGVSFIAGGSYSLGGTAAQPDAGPPLSGGAYTLAGGFWNFRSAGHQVYLPLLLRK